MSFETPCVCIYGSSSALLTVCNTMCSQHARSSLYHNDMFISIAGFISLYAEYLELIGSRQVNVIEEGLYKFPVNLFRVRMYEKSNRFLKITINHLVYESLLTQIELQRHMNRKLSAYLQLAKIIWRFCFGKNPEFY